MRYPLREPRGFVARQRAHRRAGLARHSSRLEAACGLHSNRDPLPRAGTRPLRSRRHRDGALGATPEGLGRLPDRQRDAATVQIVAIPSIAETASCWMQQRGRLHTPACVARALGTWSRVFAPRVSRSRSRRQVGVRPFRRSWPCPPPLELCLGFPVCRSALFVRRRLSFLGSSSALDRRRSLWQRRPLGRSNLPWAVPETPEESVARRTLGSFGLRQPQRRLDR